MSRHYKKPIVRPEKAREWLGRYESGEALKTIAHKDHFDIRTIKRQVESAISERDMKEARQTVLRAALEKHFNDIVALAENMRNVVMAGTAISLEPQATPLLDGLKQHLPRSPLWLRMDRWHKGLQEMENMPIKTESQLAPGYEVFRELPAKGGIRADFIVKKGEEIVVVEVKSTSREGADRQLESNFKIEEIKDDIMGMFQNPLPVGTANMVATKQIPGFCVTLAKKSGALEVLDRLTELQRQLNRIQSNLKDELNVIVLRRVVPGRCRYCPY